jgi:hypothetical protein
VYLINQKYKIYASPKSSPKERTLTSLFFTLSFGEGRVRLKVLPKI